jgi:hypothetical protein
VLIVTNVLQYAPLLAFVLHQAVKKSANERNGFIAATQMKPEEAAQLIFWPDVQRSFIFVAAIVFCGVFSEHEKALLYFRASAGTDTSLIPQAIRDLYIRLNGVHDIALSHVISSSAAIVAGSSILLIATLVATVGLCKTLLQCVARFTGLSPLIVVADTPIRTPANGILAWCSAAVFSLSCLWSFFASDGLIVRALVPVGLAALGATGSYVAYSFVLRLSEAPLWRERESRARWIFVGSLLVVRLVPSALLFYIIMSYTVTLEHTAEIVRWSTWFLAHLFYNSVVILPFMTLMLLRVPSSELEFLRASAVSSLDISKVSLLFRFRRELLIVFLFVFVLIWNGDAANSAMSSIFQSVNLELVTKLHGRHYDVTRALELILPTVALAILTITLLGSQTGLRARGAARSWSGTSSGRAPMIASA